VKIAITQPTYLPWLGYFDLLDQVDTFVLLDNVQFEKQSWQHRNRIKTPTGLQWLTVPVVFRGRFGQTIQEVEIREPEFWHKHLRALQVNYGRAPFFREYFQRLSAALQHTANNTLLAELNAYLLRWFTEVLRIGTPAVLASSLNVHGKRTELLGNICAKLGATEYLSPIGSAAYLLDELEVLTERGIQVSFQHYTHPEYKQLFPPFVPYACVLDLLFNRGERSLDIIRSGRGPAFSAEQVTAMLAEVQKA
jgi:hypothetical protein